MGNDLKNVVFSYLEENPFANLVSLKFLSSYWLESSVDLEREGGEWLVVSSFPANLFSFDRREYPDADRVVLVNASAGMEKRRFLDFLPDCRFVVKTADSDLLSLLRESFPCRDGKAFVSYTSSRAPSAAGCAGPDAVLSTSSPDGALMERFSKNGYSEEEIRGYFADGARCFFHEEEGRIVSDCFVFRNHGRIWEIAGVQTDPDCRLRGYGKRVVSAALAYLLENGLVPRYQVEGTNTASIALAESLGLERFLEIRHLVVG